MKRRVVVTGMGAVTPIGNTVEEFWNGIKTGKVGIGPITKFDTTDYKVKLAAEVKDFVGKNEWISRQQREWNCSPSMRLQQQRKHLRMRDLIWSRKILTVWEQSSVQVSEVSAV